MSQAKASRPRQAPAPAPQPVSLRRPAWVLVGILALTAAIYARSLGNGFIAFDDPDVVVNNPTIRAISGANAARWLTTPVQYMYMPLALLSYAVDHRLGGLDPSVYHLTNLLLHLGCVVLAAWVLLLLTRRPWVAVLAAALFAVHPVQVDTVASVAARTNLLATLFSLVALGCYGRYLQRGQQARYLVLAAAAFVLAASAKSSAVVLPVTLLLWDVHQGRRWDRRLLLEKLPFFAIAAAFGAVAVIMRTDDLAPPVHYGPLDRALVFVYALVHSCVRLVFPSGLSLNYDYPVVSGGALPLRFYAAPVLGLAIAWGLHALRVPRRTWAFGLAFFAVNVAPSQSVLLLDGFMADRYTYLACLGPFLVLATLLDRAVAPPPPAPRRAWVRPAAVATLALALGAASVLAYRRTLAWHDSLALLDDTLAKQPGSAWVWGTRGLVKLHGGDLTGARRDLDQALSLDPGYVPALCYRGDLAVRTHDYRAAIADLDQAIARDPRLAGAFRDRGKAKLALEDEAGARADLDRAVALDPRSEAHFWRGMLRGQQGDYHGAIDDLDVAVANARRDGGAWFLRGLARLGLGDQAGGCADVAESRRLGFQPPQDQPLPICN